MGQERLKDKFLGIAHLKQMYGIGSQDAFTYLKVREAYQHLMDSVDHILSSKGIHIPRLPYDKISHILNESRWFLSDFLTAASELSGFDRDGTLCHLQYVVGLDNRKEANKTNWFFDYSSFLQAYLQTQDHLNDYSQSLRVTLKNVLSTEVPFFTGENGLLYTAPLIIEEQSRISDPERHDEIKYDLVNRIEIKKKLENNFMVGKEPNPLDYVLERNPHEDATYLFGLFRGQFN